METRTEDPITEARAKVARLDQQLAELHEQIGDRNATSGEQERWDRLTRGRTNAQNELTRLLDEERARVFGIARDGLAIESGDGAGPVNPAALAETRDKAMFTVERHVKAGILRDSAAEVVEHLVSRGAARDRSFASRWVQATGSDAYWGAFSKYFRDPQRGHMLWSEQERTAWQAVESLKSEQRAASLTDNAGGYGTLPYQLDPSIILTGGTINPIREIARVVTTTTDKWNGVTSAGATASWDAEAAEVSDDTPTLAQPSISVHRLQTFIPFSRELEEDWAGPSLMAELARVLSDAANRLMSTAYTTGSGTGQPKGIITALAGTASEINVSGTEAFAAADVYALIEALPARWRPNARWMANLSVLNDIDQMETSNGAKLFPGMGDASPVLLRRPVHENSEMDGSWNVAATANNYILLVGDFEQFVIVDKPFSASVEVIPHLFGSNQRPTGQRGAYLYLRTGSDVTTIDAFRLLDLPTTA